MPRGGGMRGGRGMGASRGRRRRIMMMMRMMRRRRLLLLGGLIAFGAYKMSKKDAKRVEEHTGKSADELTDEELEQAMDQLGIDKQKVDQGDYAESKEDQVEASGEKSYLDELERLGQLHEDGVISDEEFEGKKKDLLDL